MERKEISDAMENIQSLCQHYGGMLSRQSDCDFPRTKVETGILNKTNTDSIY